MFQKCWVCCCMICNAMMRCFFKGFIQTINYKQVISRDNMKSQSRQLLYFPKSWHYRFVCGENLGCLHNPSPPMEGNQKTARSCGLLSCPNVDCSVVPLRLNWYRLALLGYQGCEYTMSWAPRLRLIAPFKCEDRTYEFNSQTYFTFWIRYTTYTSVYCTLYAVYAVFDTMHLRLEDVWRPVIVHRP